jgi:hypothetical protein
MKNNKIKEYSPFEEKPIIRHPERKKNKADVKLVQEQEIPEPDILPDNGLEKDEAFIKFEILIDSLVLVKKMLNTELANINKAIKQTKKIILNIKKQ